MNIFGASGHAKVIIECLETLNIEINTIFDDDESKFTILDYPIYGRYCPNQSDNKSIIIAIGDNDVRQKVASMLKHKFGKVIHPTAIVSSRAKINEGSVVLHNVVIQSSSIIGKHVIINTNASIDHDCIIEDFAHIAPNATLCGGVSIGQNTLIGAGSIVLPLIKIGKNCIVGAGSVVRFNMPENSIVTGVSYPKIRL